LLIFDKVQERPVRYFRIVHPARFKHVTLGTVANVLPKPAQINSFKDARMVQTQPGIFYINRVEP